MDRICYSIMTLLCIVLLIMFHLSRLPLVQINSKFENLKTQGLFLVSFSYQWRHQDLPSWGQASPWGARGWFFQTSGSFCRKLKIWDIFEESACFNANTTVRELIQTVSYLVRLIDEIGKCLTMVLHQPSPAVATCL